MTGAAALRVCPGAGLGGVFVGGERFIEDGALRATATSPCAVLYCRPASWFLSDHPGPDRPSAELDRLIAALSRADQDTVARFAEFLAAR